MKEEPTEWREPQGDRKEGKLLRVANRMEGASGQPKGGEAASWEPTEWKGASGQTERRGSFQSEPNGGRLRATERRGAQSEPNGREPPGKLKGGKLTRKGTDWRELHCDQKEGSLQSSRTEGASLRPKGGAHPETSPGMLDGSLAGRRLYWRPESRRWV